MSKSVRQSPPGREDVRRRGIERHISRLKNECMKNNTVSFTEEKHQYQIPPTKKKCITKTIHKIDLP
jgi:hypothetical protein